MRGRERGEGSGGGIEQTMTGVAAPRVYYMKAAYFHSVDDIYRFITVIYNVFPATHPNWNKAQTVKENAVGDGGLCRRTRHCLLFETSVIIQLTVQKRTGALNSSHHNNAANDSDLSVKNVDN